MRTRRVAISALQYQPWSVDDSWEGNEAQKKKKRLFWESSCWCGRNALLRKFTSIQERFVCSEETLSMQGAAYDQEENLRIHVYASWERTDWRHGWHLVARGGWERKPIKTPPTNAQENKKKVCRAQRHKEHSETNIFTQVASMDSFG